MQPWTDEQLRMCIEIGREIVARWPHIGPDDRHGHHDICPLDSEGRAYKIDVCGGSGGTRGSRRPAATSSFLFRGGVLG